MSNYIKMLILSIFSTFFPNDAFATFLPHDYPAIYIHMIGRVFFFFAMIALISFIVHHKLVKEKPWKYFLTSIVLFSLWNLMVFIGRFYDLPLPQGEVGWQYFKREFTIYHDIELLFYFTRYDMLVLDLGMLFLYFSLRLHLKVTKDTDKQVLIPAFSLPFLPIAIAHIIGGSIFVVLAALCLTMSVRLYKKERDNLLWKYMIWFTTSLLVYATSRAFAYIFSHIFVATSNRSFWENIEPISGSVNTIFFFWIGFISLFFIVVYKAYLKIQEDERKLQRVNVDLIQLNRELETLVAERTMALMGLTVADKVRNPAVLIGALCRRIIKKEEKLNQDILDIIDECKKLETIVGEFESLLKTRQSAFEYGDLNELINSIIYTIEQEANAKQVSFTLNLSEEPMRINLQRNLLKSAIYHVIRNAIEATPPGGKITISTNEEGEKIILTISDTGRGIHPDNLDKIFDPFFTTKELRFGMGLPLVRQIVSEHLGELKITSELGKGTTVKMIFPIRWKPQR